MILIRSCRKGNAKGRDVSPLTSELRTCEDRPTPAIGIGPRDLGWNFLIALLQTRCWGGTSSPLGRSPPGHWLCSRTPTRAYFTKIRSLSGDPVWAAGHDDTSCQKPRTDGRGCPSRRCDYCLCTSQGGGGGRGEGGQPLLRCARSKLARYCSREHQAEAWRKGGYQSECKALVAGAPRVPPPTVRLAARVLWRRLRCEGRWILQDTM
jgi:hypothetical protein